ncbi:MAG TPA: TonB family protein [Terracidiphilus sp.]|nr:TonB family protein [Terracidiphilus sp.]
MDASEHLEQELRPEPMKGPAVGSLLLHAGLAASIVFYGLMAGFFHHNEWGGSAGGNAIQVNLVSNTLPLPSDQPQNQNVLSTETPSQAPTAPTPKTEQKIDETAIPIQGRQKKPEKQTQQRNVVKPMESVPQNRAQYGEQTGSSMPRAAQNYSNGPTTLNDANFGSMFPWYVDNINRTMSMNWSKSLVDQNTPRGAKAYIDFVISRDGTVSNVRIERSSGSSTLDSSCMRAAQRAASFGALPQQYRGSTLQVSFYCEY